MTDTSPTKWHRAHTTWFFETFVLERFEPGYRPVDPNYRMLFNSYYELVGPKYPRPDRGMVTRPGIAEVAAYRAAVDERMNQLLADAAATPDELVELVEVVELGIQHEQQHQELLLMDIKHVLSLNPLEPVYRTQHPPPEQRDPSQPGELGWFDVEGGLVEVGAPGRAFAFDNEQPIHLVHLEPYRLGDRLITAGEWRDFIDDGGYARPELWLSDGWAQVREHGSEAPLYWKRRDDSWVVHTLGGTRSVTDHEPVCHVSYFEADAFARWAGARLPTEAEWEHAAVSARAEQHCFELDRLHPRPANPSPAFEVTQLRGACWQWTASAYLPYPGFAPAAGAVGEYNGKFMSGQMVLRGGSALTPTDHAARPSYRNFFPPHSRWPMTGVRLASGGEPR